MKSRNCFLAAFGILLAGIVFVLFGGLDSTLRGGLSRRRAALEPLRPEGPKFAELAGPEVATDTGERTGVPSTVATAPASEPEPGEPKAGGGKIRIDPDAVKLQGSPVSWAMMDPTYRLVSIAKGDGIKLAWRRSSDRLAIRSVIEGKADFALVNVDLTRREADKGLTELPLGAYVPALVVHPDNDLARLDRDDWAALLTGEIEDWSELGAEPGPIRFVRPENPALVQRLANLIIPGRRLAGEGVGDEGSVIDAVSSDPRAIGLTSSAMVDSAVRALEVDGTAPSGAAFRAGRYPFGCNLRLVHNGMKNGAAARFHRLLTSAESREYISLRLGS